MSRIMSTILGIVVESDNGYVVYNYSQHQRYSLSKEQFEALNVGNFPYIQFAVPRYAEHDVIGYDGHICFVQNRKLFDIRTKERCLVKQSSFANRGFKGPRPFIKLCCVIKHCCSYEDIMAGPIDERLEEAASISSFYGDDIPAIAINLLNMIEEDPKNRAFFNPDWVKACNTAIPYLTDRGEFPVMSEDVLRY